MSSVDFNRDRWIHTYSELWGKLRGYEPQFAEQYVRKVADLFDGNADADGDNIITLWDSVVWRIKNEKVLVWIDRTFDTDFEIYEAIDALTL